VEHTTSVKPHIDDALDELKRGYNGLKSMLSDIARKLLNDFPMNIRSNFAGLALQYYPRLGYFVTIPCDDDVIEALQDPTVRADHEIPDWQYVFKSEGIAYFKDDVARRLDNEYGDLWTMICGEFLLQV